MQNGGVNVNIRTYLEVKGSWVLGLGDVLTSSLLEECVELCGGYIVSDRLYVAASLAAQLIHAVDQGLPGGARRC